jgi:hypothetical protein
MHRHEGAYYRHRNAIMAFHRLTRIACVVRYAAVRNTSLQMPPPLLGNGAGGGMRELIKTLAMRGGSPYPWIYVLNFPVPFPLQARARRSLACYKTSAMHSRLPPLTAHLRI